MCSILDARPKCLILCVWREWCLFLLFKICSTFCLVLGLSCPAQCWVLGAENQSAISLRLGSVIPVCCNWGWNDDDVLVVLKCFFVTAWYNFEFCSGLKYWFHIERQQKRDITRHNTVPFFLSRCSCFPPQISLLMSLATFPNIFEEVHWRSTLELWCLKIVHCWQIEMAPTGGISWWIGVQPHRRIVQARSDHRST